MALAPDIPTGLAAPRRARSFAVARGHTRIVRLLKFVIPAGSLIAVAILVAWSMYNPFARIPGLTVGPITVSGSKIAMESPRLTGFRKDNRPYEVTATTAYQDIRKPNVVELKEMRAKLTVDESGTVANLVSTSGILDTGREHLDLKDDIRIWTDKGEEVLLKSASFDLKANAGSSREAVRIRTPTMSVDANGMEMAENGKRITFTGGVRTILKRDGDGVATGSVKSGSAPKRVNQAEAGSGR